MDNEDLSKPIQKHKGAGHRGRLRQRFLQGGLNSFLDYEIVELLLTLGTPRRDCKQIAKDAITKFKGLRGVLNASLEELQQVKGVGPSNAFGIKLFQAVSERYSKEQIIDNIVFESPESVAQFIQKLIGREKKEHFVMLSLGTANNLLKVSTVSIGSLDSSIVHPREVFKEAIQHSAAQIIIAHNHPSGSLEKSGEDTNITSRLTAIGELINIPVVDHIIVTAEDFVSFKAEGWL